MKSLREVKPDWMLAAASFVVGVLLILVAHANSNSPLDAWHVSIRYSIRFCAVIFLVIFLSGALKDLAGLGVFVKYRRWIGISFAVAFLIHLYSVTMFLSVGGYLPKLPALIMDLFTATFILVMTVTSNDFLVRVIGYSNWKRLHLVGIYAIWLTLFVPFSSRIRLDFSTYPYWLFSAALVLVLIVRFTTKK